MKTIFYSREEYNELTGEDISQERWDSFDLYPVKSELCDQP